MTMSSCDECLRLGIPRAIHQLQYTEGTGRPDDDEAGWMYGWHNRARDVFRCAEVSKCGLCVAVARGWQDYRAAAIIDSSKDGMIDAQVPPDDLDADVQNIPAYNNGEVQTVVLRLERADDGRQRWSYALRVACIPESTVGWDVHHELFAELKIAKNSRLRNSGEDSYGHLDMDWTVSESPTSAESVKVARSWLETCVSNHSSCHQEDGNSKMPSRFLDLGDPNYPDFVVLRETSDYHGIPPTDLRYVALSHCWGTARIITTVRANIEDHKRAIKFGSLPQTFKDAIQIVQKFQLRYIWIDSLCIIQDDTDDWEKEAAQMADVYRNAYFVLGATRGESDTIGFLSPRQRAPGSTVFSDFTFSPLPPLLHRWTTGVDMMKNEPLSDRAWCLQERYLARRMLMYGSTQAAWECAELRASEDGESIYEEGDQLSRILQTANTGISVFGDVLPTAWNTDLLPRRRETVVRYADWYRMVEQYTTRNITKDPDRLPALLGVANALGAITGDEYIAGIWLGGLLEGLAWCAVDKDGLQEPQATTSPSWSWVSVKGPVQFPVYSWYEYSQGWQFEQVKFVPLAGYVEHSLVGGTLHLTAPIVAVTGHHQRPVKQPVNTENWVPEPQFSPSTDTVFGFRHGSREVWVEGGFDIKQKQNHQCPLFVMFLVRLPFHLGEEQLYRCLGLVLEMTGTAYERVGFVDSCILEAENIDGRRRFLNLPVDINIFGYQEAAELDSPDTEENFVVDRQQVILK
ncbi:heterokaryon incompatibility protein-domain-containing protein [Annulohypoxylon maeteangense]|uniref:heterokaryon incompatibility protein-domain-containing protein n=1 Tax=Annulohypoxylon maeteangense TaxID=1927788 RepID=UPI0020083087|nr:heterokaryon incompatibility protein-domain-containing protein [Annulohypoxylon maeteangense]KAI0888329.1 heterokaryon incompatibility protein-domain-containing protein [Annulohypoxylon maeteangense]